MSVNFNAEEYLQGQGLGKPGDPPAVVEFDGEKFLEENAQIGPGIQSNVSGFDIDEYSDYVKTIRSLDNIDVKRAHGQSGLEQFGNMFIQAGGSIIGDTVSGVGAIGEIVSYLWDDNRDFNNGMMRVGEAISQGSRDVAPIYRTNEGKAFDLGDTGWWTSMFPSLVSTVSAMIPGYGVVKGIGMVGRAAKLAKFGKGLARTVKSLDFASDLAKAGTNTLIAASVSRNAENMREAMDVYNTGYASTLEALQTEEGKKKIKNSWAYHDAREHYGKSDLSDEEIATYIAGKGAQRAYNINWSNIGFDIAQAAMPYFKGVRGLTRIGTTSKGLMEAQNLATKGAKTLSRAQKFNYLTNPYMSVIGGSVTEGIEEAVNFIGGAEGRAYIEHMKGNFVDPMSMRMNEYFKDGHLWEGAVLGMAGGAMFSGGGMIMNRDKRKMSESSRLAEMQVRSTRLAALYSQLQDIQNSTELNEKQKKMQSDALVDKISYETGLAASVHGNMGLAMEELNSETFKEKILDLGISEDEYNATNARIKERMEFAEKMYGKYRGNPLTAVGLDENAKAHINALKVQNAGAVDGFNRAKNDAQAAYNEELQSVPQEVRDADGFEPGIELAAIENVLAENITQAQEAGNRAYREAKSAGMSETEAQAERQKVVDSFKEMNKGLEERYLELKNEGHTSNRNYKDLVSYKSTELINRAYEIETNKRLVELDNEAKQQEIAEANKKRQASKEAQARKDVLQAIEDSNDLAELKEYANDSDKQVSVAAKNRIKALNNKKKNNKRGKKADAELKGPKGSPAAAPAGTPSPGTPATPGAPSTPQTPQARNAAANMGIPVPGATPGTPAAPAQTPVEQTPAEPPQSQIDEAQMELPFDQDNTPEGSDGFTNEATSSESVPNAQPIPQTPMSEEEAAQKQVNAMDPKTPGAPAVPGTPPTPGRPASVPSNVPEDSTVPSVRNEEGEPVDNPTKPSVNLNGLKLISPDITLSGFYRSVFNKIGKIVNRKGGFFSTVKAITSELIESVKPGQSKFYLDSLQELANLKPGDKVIVRRSRNNSSILEVSVNNKQVAIFADPANAKTKSKGVDATYVDTYNKLAAAVDAKGEIEVAVESIQGGNKVVTNQSSSIAQDFESQIDEYGFVMPTKESNYTELDSPNSIKGESVTASQVNNADGVYSPENVYVLVPAFGGQLMPVAIRMATAGDLNVQGNLGQSLANIARNPGSDVAKGAVSTLRENFVTGQNGITSTDRGVSYRVYEQTQDGFEADNAVTVEIYKNGDQYTVTRTDASGKLISKENIVDSYLETYVTKDAANIRLSANKSKLNTDGQFEFNGRTYDNYNQFVAQNSTHRLGYTLLPNGQKLFVSPYSAGKPGEEGYRPGMRMDLAINKQDSQPNNDMPRVSAVKEVTPEQQESIDAAESVENTTEDPFDDDINDDPLGALLMRADGEQATDGREPVDLDAMEVEWRKMFPNIPFKRVEGLIKNGGELAFGMFTESAVYLSTNAVPGTHYHEGFHTAMHLYLDEKQRKQIYGEGRAMLGYMSKSEFKRTMQDLGIKVEKVSDLTDLQVEEFLAERFRSEMLAGNIPTTRTPKTAIGRFFQTLMRFIQDFTGIRREKMYERLFKDIKGGKFTYEPTEQMRNHAKNIGMNMRVPGFTSLEKAQAVRAMSVMTHASYNYVLNNWENLKDKGYSFDALVRLRTAKYLESYRKKAVEAARQNQASYDLVNLSKATEHFDALYEETKREYKAKFNRDIDRVSNRLSKQNNATDADAVVEQDDMTIEELQDVSAGEMIRNWDDSLAEYDSKKNASSLVRQTILTSHKLSNFSYERYQSDGTSTPIGEDFDRATLFGTPEFLDFDLTYNYLKTHLAGITSTEELLSRLLELTRAYPSVGSLYLKLRSNPSLASAFTVEFSGQVVPIIRHEIGSTGVKHQVLNVNDSSYTLASNWRNNTSTVGEFAVPFDRSRFKRLIKDGNVKAASEYLQSVLESYGISMQEGSINMLGSFVEKELTHAYNTGTIDKVAAELISATTGIESGVKDSEVFSPFIALGNMMSKYDIRMSPRVFRTAANTNIQGVVARNPIGDFFQLMNNPAKEAEFLQHLSNLGRDPRVRASKWYTMLTETDADGNLALRKDPEALRWRANFNYSLSAGMKVSGEVGAKNARLKTGDFETLQLLSFLQGTNNRNQSQGQVGINQFNTPNNTQFNITTEISSEEDLVDQLTDAVLAEVAAMEQAFNTYFEMQDGQIVVKRDENGVPVNLPLHAVADANGNFQKDGVLTGRLFKSQIFPGIEEMLFAYTENGPRVIVTRNEIKNMFNGAKQTQPAAYDPQTIINKEASKELRRIKSLQKTHGNYITMPEGKTEADVARHFALYKMVHNINMAGFFTGYASDNKNTTDVFKRYNNAALMGKQLDTSAIPEERAKGVTVMVGKDIKRDAKSIEGGESSDMYQALQKGFARLGYTNAQAAAKASEYINNYKGIDAQDAQGYITLDRYEDIIRGQGKWDENWEKAFAAARKGEANDATVQKYFLPIKGFFSGQVTDPTTGLVHQHMIKYSAMPLLPQVVNANPELKALSDQMNKKGAQEYVPHSAYKMSAPINADQKGITPAFNDEYLEGVPTVTLPHSTYRVLQDVPAKLINARTVFGAQISKLIVSNINPSATYIVDGKEVVGKNLIKDYNRLVSRYIKQQKDLLFKELQIQEDASGIYIKDYKPLARRIKNSLGQEASDVLEEAISVDPVTGMFKIPAYHPGVSSKIESVFTSLFTKELITLKVPGTSAVQASSVGFEGTEYERPTLVFNEDGGIDHAEIYLPRHMQEQFEGVGRTLTYEEIKEQYPELLTMIGYRIPTESKSTAVTLKVKGFLPDAMANTVVVPDEIVVMMGADFDLDKLFMQFRSPVKNSVSNNIMDIMQAVLQSPEHTVESLSPQEPTDLRKAANAVSTEEELTLPYAHSTHAEMRVRDKAGAELLGLAANLNSLIPVAQITGMRFSEPIEVEYPASKVDVAKLKRMYGEENVVKTGNKVLVKHSFIGRTNNGQFVDVNGNLITTNVKQFVGAAADNTKDPVFDKFNGNVATMNTILAMTAVGIPYEVTFNLMTLPIVKHYADKTLEGRGIAGTRDYNVYATTVQTLAEELQKLGYVADIGAVENMQTLVEQVKAVRDFGSTYVPLSEEAVKQVKREAERLVTLKEQIEAERAMGVDVTSLENQYKEARAVNLLKQGSLLAQFQKIKKLGDQLGNASRVFKADNTQVGPQFDNAQNLIEGIFELQGEGAILIDDVPAPERIYPQLFEKKGTSAYPILEAALMSAHVPADQLSQTLMPSESVPARDMAKELIRLNLLKPSQRRLLKQFLNRSYIFHNVEFFQNMDSDRVVGYRKQKMTPINKKMDISSFRNLSAAEKVQYLKLHHASEVPFGDPMHVMGRLSGKPSMKQAKQNKGMQVVEYNGSTDVDVINAMSETFEEMYFSDNEFISETAKDLIRYSFATTGLAYGPRSLGGIISPAVLNDLGFDALSTQFDPTNHEHFIMSGEEVNDFVANNFDELPIRTLPKEGKSVAGKGPDQIITYDTTTTEETPLYGVTYSKSANPALGSVKIRWRLASAQGETVKYERMKLQGVPGRYTSMTPEVTTQAPAAQQSRMLFDTMEEKQTTNQKVAALTSAFRKIGIDVTVNLDPDLDANAQVTGNGTKATITLNPNRVFGDTVIHEFGHIYVDLLGVNNPLVQQAIEQLKGTKLWKDVERAYPELSGDALAKEVVVTAMGREGAEIYKEKRAQSKWRTLLNKIFRAIGKLFGVEPNAARELARQMLSNNMQRNFQGSLSETAQFQKRASSLEGYLEDKKLKLARIKQEYGDRAEDISKILEDIESLDYLSDAMSVAQINGHVSEAVQNTLTNISAIRAHIDSGQSLTEAQRRTYYDFLHNASVTLGAFQDLVTLDPEWAGENELLATEIKELKALAGEVETALTRVAQEREFHLLKELEPYVSNPEIAGDIAQLLSPKSTRTNDISNTDIGMVQLGLDALADANIPFVAVAAKMYKTEEELSNMEAQKLQAEWEEFADKNADILDEMFEVVDGKRTGRWVQKDSKQYKALMRDPRKKAMYEYVMNLMTDLVGHTSNYYFEEGFIPAVPNETIKDVWKRAIDFKKGEDINNSVSLDENGNVIGVIPLGYASFLEQDKLELLEIDEENDTKEEIREKKKENARRRREAHAEVLDFNIKETMQLFIPNAMRHKFKSSIESKMKLVGEQIAGMQFESPSNLVDKVASKVKGEESMAMIEGKDSNIYKRYNHWMNMVFYENFDQDATNNPKLSKAARYLQNYMSITGIGFNVYSAINNRVYGGIQVAIEAAAGEHFGKKEYGTAKKQYNSNMMRIFADRNKRRTDNKVSGVIKLFDVLQSQDELARRSGGPARSAIEKALWVRDAAFAMQKSGEHLMQNQALLAMLQRKKVKLNGQEITLFDAFEMKDGIAVLKEGVTHTDSAGNEVPFTQKDVAQFKTKVLAVNQHLHGIYTKADAGTIQRYALGRMAMQFRKWARPGWNKRFGARWGKSYWNERRESLDEGMYVSTYNFLMDLIKDTKKLDRNYKLYYDQLLPQQKANLRRTAAEMAYLAGVLALGALLANIDLEDDDPVMGRLMASLVYQVDRTKTELRTYTPVGWFNDGKKLMASPIPAMSRLETAFKLLRHVYTLDAFNEEEKYYKGGRYYGESKTRIWLRSLLPGFAQFDRIAFIQNNARYYKLYE